MTSPYSAFPGERLPGLGHNQGPPLEAGRSWRRFTWTKARKDLLPNLPLEVVKRRIARAKQLGLEYPQYASILLGTGRDVVAFLFTADALGMRVQRTPVLPRNIAAKLGHMDRCDKLLTGDASLNPIELSAEIVRQHKIQITGTHPLPLAGQVTWSAGRDAIHAALRPMKIPTDAVVMIGTEQHERTWADAARLAKFIPSQSYFS